VLTVKVIAVPGAAEVGLIEHFGARTGVGWTEHDSATVLLKPSIAVSATVEVDDAPALIVPGEKADAAIEKSTTAKL
jgi:hypothetical protein